MKIGKIYAKGQLQIKYYVKNHLIMQKNPKHDGYQRIFALIDCKFFDKKSVVGAVKDKIVLNEQSAEH